LADLARWMEKKLFVETDPIGFIVEV
jgi:hypothetical protein